MNGQSAEQFGSGERHPIDASMRKSLNLYMNQLTKADLSAYTFERRRSDYDGAKSDLVVYDASGTAVIHGREFDSGSPRLTFWLD